MGTIKPFILQGEHITQAIGGNVLRSAQTVRPTRGFGEPGSFRGGEMTLLARLSLAAIRAKHGEG